jgi:hypothetical protein
MSPKEVSSRTLIASAGSFSKDQRRVQQTDMTRAKKGSENQCERMSIVQSPPEESDR